MNSTIHAENITPASELATFFENVTLAYENKTEETSVETSRIIVTFFTVTMVLATSGGNLIVLMAFVLDRKLAHQNHFNYYIINLAVTDLSVPLLSSWLYMVDTLLGYWPFGEVMCGIWIFLDYTVTFASVYTIMVISADRYWSVTWSVQYRQYNTKRKVFIAIFLIWVASFLVWTPPLVIDRVKLAGTGMCKWEPNENQIAVVLVSLFGYNIPTAVMIFSYIKVFIAMRKRHKVKAADRFTNKLTVSTIKMHGSSSLTPVQIDTGSGNRTSGQSDNTQQLDDSAVFSASATQGSTASNSGKLTKTHPMTKRSKRNIKESANDKEGKVFITLSYVVIGYLVTWVPFHVVFPLSAFWDDLVPESIYTMSIWMAHLNSTINPILYAYSSKELRTSFAKVFKCKKTS